MPKKKSTHTYSNRSLRRLSVRGVLRKTPDLDKIAGTLEALAIAQAEKDAADSAREKESSDER